MIKLYCSIIVKLGDQPVESEKDMNIEEKKHVPYL